MLKKVLSFALVVFVVNLTFATTVNAAVQTDKDAQRAERVKAKILKIGARTKTRVRLGLRNNTTVVGFIRETSDKDFVVADEKSGVTTTIPYSQVKLVDDKFDPRAEAVRKFAVIAALSSVTALLILFIGKASR